MKIKKKNKRQCYFIFAIILLIFSVQVGCTDDSTYSSSRDFIFKNNSSYMIQYYTNSTFYEKDSLLFELPSNSEIKIEEHGIDGEEDGRSVDNCCKYSLYGYIYGSDINVIIKCIKADEEKCVTYAYGEGPGDYLNFDIVKKGFNYFELTYTFTDSTLSKGTVCE